VKNSTIWIHPRAGQATWGELKRMFQTVGGITQKRAQLLGWRVDEFPECDPFCKHRMQDRAAFNPVNVMLG
jgi:hypothetical protein